MKYRVIPHWEKKYPDREGEIPKVILSEKQLQRFLEEIFAKEQNDVTPRNSPSASVGDIIVLENGRKFRIEDEGFMEMKEPVIRMGEFEFDKLREKGEVTYEVDGVMIRVVYEPTIGEGK